MLAPFAKEHDVRPFELPGVNLFTANELDPTDEPDAALIFGGDGTLHRHLGTLALKKIPVLPVPIGSANDFATTMGIHSVDNALTAWVQFCATGINTLLVDLGTMQPLLPFEASELLSAVSDDDGDEPWVGDRWRPCTSFPTVRVRDLPQLGPRIEKSEARRWFEAERQVTRTRYFACIAGTGLDAVVSREVMDQPRWLRTHGGYVWSLIKSLPRFRAPEIAVSLEIDGCWQTPVREPAVLIAAGNGPQYGSGMRLAHLADMDDGLLDVCFVRNLSKLRLLRLFHVVFSGRHIGMKEVEYWKAKRVRIQTDPVMDLYADGEFVCSTPVELAVEREALQVIVPA